MPAHQRPTRPNLDQRELRPGDLQRPRTALLVLAVVVSIVPAMYSQSQVQRTRDEMRASYVAHQADCDYLLGVWEFTGVSQEFGGFHGFWSAVRLPGGQILDKYRIVDDKGQPTRVTTTLRAYNAGVDRWELVGMDSGGGLQNTGTGKRVGSEMQIEQKFGVANGNPFTLQIRYFDIQPDHFFWTADRTTDNGKTWTRNLQQLEAHRIGPPRSIELFFAGRE